MSQCLPKTLHPSFYYNAFGLTFHSTFKISHLPESTCTKPDVHIYEAELVEPKNWDPKEQFHFSTSFDEVTINFQGRPFIRISRGREIIVNQDLSSFEKEREVYILASSIAAILIQKGFLVLHGAAVLHEDQVTAFLGPRGIGKSTLSAGLIKRGYTVIGDDICAIKKDASGQIAIFTPLPTLKITDSSKSSLSLVIPEGLKHCDQKYWLTLDKIDAISYPLSSIYFLSTHEEVTLSINLVKGSSALEQLLKNLYRPGIISGLNLWKDNFSLLGDLAQSIVIGEISRPINGFSLYSMLDLIEEKIF